MALGPKAMGEAILRNLEEKTGRPLAEWLEILTAAAPNDKQAAAEMLKQQYGLGHFQAQKVAATYHRETPYADGQKLIAELFPDETSRRTFDALRAHILELGNDIREVPCRSYVPYSRGRQFVLLAPRGEADVLVGLALEEGSGLTGLTRSCKLGSKRINYSFIVIAGAALSPGQREAIRVAYQAADRK